MKIIYYYFIIAFTTFPISLVGQPSDPDSVLNSHVNRLNDEMVRVAGFMDYSIPVTLLHSRSDTCSGIVQFGKQTETIHIEGICTDSLIQMYEFDEHARVTGVIEGTIEGTDYNLSWANHNKSRAFSLFGKTDQLRNDELLIFNGKDEEPFSQLVLRTDLEQLVNSRDDKHALKWTDYNCSRGNYACQYISNDGKETHLSISDKVVSAGSNLFYLSDKISIRRISDHNFSYYYNYTYPVLNNEEFDKFINNTVRQQKEKFISSIRRREDDSEPSDRLAQKANGEFFISLITKDLISGYLSFYSTSHPRPETVPFTFDRQKKKFVDIKSVWKKDFNYSFYLQSLIKEERRNIVKREESSIKNLLRTTPFSHFVFGVQGLSIFTDYNLIFGRRNIPVQYSDIDSFIENKSLLTFIRKNRIP